MSERPEPCGSPAWTVPVDIKLADGTVVAGSRKPTNPKDIIGVRKVRLTAMPLRVLWDVALAFMEGAKYGLYNYRDAGVRGSVYADAAMGHIAQWFEGEDIDQDSGLNHITKAIASLMVLRDGMLHENWVDDRPVKAKDGWKREMDKTAVGIIDRIGHLFKPSFLQKGRE